MPRPRSENPTPGELEVLQIIWQHGACTVRQVLQELNKSRERAYTSVMSLLNVMVEKGLLQREPEGKAFLYSAAVQEQPTLRRMVGDLVERVFRGSPRMLVAHALEQTDPSPRELDELQQLIDQYRARQQPAADEDQ